MSLINAAMFSEEGLEQNTDSIGGSYVLPSGEYNAVIKSNYLGESSGGAVSLTILAQVTSHDGEVSEYRETLYITNKNKQNFYVKPDGNKTMLPGCRVVNDLCLVTCGKGLNGITTEERVVSAYSPEKKDTIPMNKEVIVDLIGAECRLLITEEIRNKQTKNNMGVYVDTPEKVSRNVISKVLNTNGLTAVEIQQVKEGKEISEPFRVRWLGKNENKPYNKYKQVAATTPLGATEDTNSVGDMLRL